MTTIKQGSIALTTMTIIALIVFIAEPSYLTAGLLGFGIGYLTSSIAFFLLLNHNQKKVKQSQKSN